MNLPLTLVLHVGAELNGLTKIHIHTLLQKKCKVLEIAFLLGKMVCQLTSGYASFCKLLPEPLDKIFLTLCQGQ